MNIVKILCDEFSVKETHIENVLKLIEDGNTIPFIARYRKEMHGSLDDQVLREISDRAEYLKNLSERKEEIIRLIDEQEKLTDELVEQINACVSLTALEDIYRPYRPKRRTRGMVAREKGLEPLAEIFLLQEKNSDTPENLALDFIDEEKEVLTVEDAIAGAMDIIAEDISDSADVRQKMRDLFMKFGIVEVVASNPEENSVYEMYYDFDEKVRTIAGYRILAINRGEKEEFLKVKITADEEKAMNIIYDLYLKEGSPCSEVVKNACDDSYKRLIYPSIERETRNTLSETAANEAISVFAVNLENLLMQPPIKGLVTLGLDPGFRTGCKLAVVDATGRVLDTGVIYNTPPNNKVAEAKKIVLGMIQKHGVHVISIGNGTASRESEQFVAELITENNLDVAYVIVNEAGASVYSASKLASQEFPEFDVSIRSAVSIARRLQDPLAELVKIDPKSVGVGQYQHDMPQNELDSALGTVVEDCVNSVGVDLNTASAPLLNYVAGINSTVAKNIVVYREENGAFYSRKELNSVARLGKKAFEQCAGFLRVSESENVLDNTGVHPESYAATKKLLKLTGFTLDDVKDGKLENLPEIVREKGQREIADELEIGIPTLLDIVKELVKPGRDPRDDLPKPILRKDVMSMEDLTEGMELVGTVRNVIDFGAFVDIGVHEDGLVHISELSDRFIKHPSEVVKVGDIVNVKVLNVDKDRKRIGLSMKGLN